MSETSEKRLPSGLYLCTNEADGCVVSYGIYYKAKEYWPPGQDIFLTITKAEYDALLKLAEDD